MKCYAARKLWMDMWCLAPPCNMQCRAERWFLASSSSSSDLTHKPSRLVETLLSTYLTLCVFSWIQHWGRAWHSWNHLDSIYSKLVMSGQSKGRIFNNELRVKGANLNQVNHFILFIYPYYRSLLYFSLVSTPNAWLLALCFIPRYTTFSDHPYVVSCHLTSF